MRKNIVFGLAMMASLTVVVMPTTAQSNTRICSQLERQANALRQGTSGATRVSLERDLRKVDRQVRRAGCTGFRSLFNGGKRHCRALQAKRDRLRSQIRRPSRGRSSQGQLARIEAAKRQHGCRSAAVTTARAVNRNGYRTVCVRKCDGYYFPVGFSTQKSNLKRDAAVCSNFYPDSEAELYVQPTPSSNEAADMVSLQGEKYAEQPFAFAYRSQYDAACAGGLRMASSRETRGIEVDPSAQIPFPVPRPVLLTEKTNKDTSIRAAAPDPEAMRIVGPEMSYVVFLPDDEQDGASGSSAPKRVASGASGTSWLGLIASLFSVSAQAGETDGDRAMTSANES